jgi:hypothetical protein
MSFNRDGSLLATTCKDKQLRIIEPRTVHLWKMLSEGGMEVKWSPFRFPHCQISRAN